MELNKEYLRVIHGVAPDSLETVLKLIETHLSSP